MTNVDAYDDGHREHRPSRLASEPAGDRRLEAATLSQGSAPLGLSPSVVMALQRTVGNRRVTLMLGDGDGDGARASALSRCRPALMRDQRRPPRASRSRTRAPIVVDVDVVLLLLGEQDRRRARSANQAMRDRVRREIAYAQRVWLPARRRFRFRFRRHEARPELTRLWLGSNGRLDNGDAGREHMSLNIRAVHRLGLTAPIRVFYVPSAAEGAVAHGAVAPAGDPIVETELRASRGSGPRRGEEGMIVISMDRPRTLTRPRQLAHELGHMLGLGHETTDTSQIMMPSDAADPGRVLDRLSPGYIEEAARGAARPNAGQDPVPALRSVPGQTSSRPQPVRSGPRPP
jgi:hypothetical protein